MNVVEPFTETTLSLVSKKSGSKADLKGLGAAKWVVMTKPNEYETLYGSTVVVNFQIQGPLTRNAPVLVTVPGLDKVCSFDRTPHPGLHYTFRLEHHASQITHHT